MWCSFSSRSRSVPPLHKAARPGTRDSVSRCSASLHTVSHRLAERNRSVALRSLFMSGLDAPARLSRAKVRATVHYSQDSARAGRTVIHRISVRASGSCRGLRPCPLCHLCPATATAIAVAASGPKQHRPSDERPLRPQCEVQRHHPREGNCRIYIFIYSLGVVDNCIWKVYSNGDSEYQIFPSIIHRYSLIITCLCQNYLLNSPIISEILKD